MPRRKIAVIRRPRRARIISTRECNTHLADVESEKDLRRDRYLKGVHNRVAKNNKELVRNFRAAKKWALQRGTKTCKIRKTRVDGTESKLFQASVVKKHAILNNRKDKLFDRNILARKELRNYLLEISKPDAP